MWKVLNSVKSSQKKFNVGVACNSHPQDTFSADAQHNFLKLRKILKSATW